jgi:tetratricopeptide (TPR) repeat protein
LGNAARARGDYDQAATRYEAALVINKRIGRQDGEAECLHGLGAVAWALGDKTQAMEHYTQALAIYERLGLEHHAAPLRKLLSGLQEGSEVSNH